MGHAGMCVIQERKAMFSRMVILQMTQARLRRDLNTRWRTFYLILCGHGQVTKDCTLEQNQICFFNPSFFFFSGDGMKVCWRGKTLSRRMSWGIPKLLDQSPHGTQRKKVSNTQALNLILNLQSIELFCCLCALVLNFFIFKKCSH